MNKTLRKATLQYMLPWIIISAVLAVGFLAVAMTGLLKMAAGADAVSSESLENGNYVSFDASEVIVAFANLTQSDSEGNNTVTLKTYYLLPDGNGKYLAVMDRKEANAEVLDKAMEQSYSYYMEDLETLTKLGTLSGTVGTLESDMEGYMTDVISEYALPGSDGDNLSSLILPYQINIGRVGFLTSSLAVILGCIGGGFLVIFLLLLIPVMTGAYQKKALARVTAEHTKEEAEQIFADAQVFERVHVSEYIWYPAKAFTKCIRTEDLIWGYIMPEPLVVSRYRWPVALFDREKKQTTICFADKKQAEKFLDAVAAQGYPFVSGYSTTLNERFKGSVEDFEKLATASAKS